MDIKDFCSYETAKNLKVAGYDMPCQWYYNKENFGNGVYWPNETSYHLWYNNMPDADVCAAPFLWQAQKWLREAKNMDVLVWNCSCGYGWEISKAARGTTILMFDGEGEDEASGMWLSYEAALQDGIKNALKLINK